MDWLMVVLSALGGYLIGGISFARIIARFTIPGKDISKVEQIIPGTDRVFTMTTVSASTMHMHAGTRYGCLTAILDMAKVAFPTLGVRLLSEGMPYHLILAASAVAGHNWPVYYGFKGGRGESPMIGGFLAVDWLGVLLTNAVGSIAGVVVGSLLVMRWSWMMLMIAWIWWRTGDLWHVGYAIVAVMLYVIALLPELRQYVRLKQDHAYPSQESVAEVLTMGKTMGRMMDRYSLFALYHRLRARKS